MESLFGLATVQWDHEPRVESKPSRRGRTPRSDGSSGDGDPRGPASWTAAGSEAPRRFGLCGISTPELEVAKAILGRAKAPSPLRSAGALQTLRARGRVSGGRVSVWSACIFSAAFPRQVAIRWPGRFMESPHAIFAVHWDAEAVRIPLNRPPGTFSPSGGEGWDEGVRFMERLPDRDWVPAAPDCEICPAHLSARRPVPAPEQGELRSRRPRRPNPEPGRFGGIQAFSA